MDQDPLNDEQYLQSIESFYEPIIEDEIQKLNGRRLHDKAGRLIFDGQNFIESSFQDNKLMNELER